MSIVIEIDTNDIKDWESLHNVFQERFEFPAYYGRNMDAWIDCMADLDDPESGASFLKGKRGVGVVLVLKHAESFSVRCPAQYQAILECTANVNLRRLESGAPALISLAL